jgi:hypothetical protein
MTVASPPAPPNGRTLSGWWRQLASQAPSQLWFVDWPILRVDALVRVRRGATFDPLQRFLLEMLSCNAATTAELGTGTGFGEPFVRHHLTLLRKRGLVASAAERWSITELGRAAVASGECVAHALERRTFSLLLPERPGEFPVYVPIHTSGTPLPIPAGAFDLSHLNRFIHQSARWKELFDFPREIEAIIQPGDADESPAWLRIPIIRAERITGAIIHTIERLLGFSVKAESWSLQAAEPMFRLPSEVASDWPELADPGPEAWRAAWREWARSHRLPPDDVETAELHLEDYRLRVRGSSAVEEKVRSAAADAWILAGLHRSRRAAMLSATP